MEFSVEELGPSSMVAERYMILEQLGEAPFGIVFKAVELETDQHVVLKLLHPGDINADAAPPESGTLRAEMKRLARLKHPHMAHLHDWGFLKESGHIYMIRRYLEGESLAEVIESQGTLNPKEAVHIMLQVLDSIIYAHERGVLHSNLTPHNVLLGPGGMRRNASILDFGVVSFMGRAFDIDIREHGDPAYMAPEQLHADAPEATSRSDIYSWGLIFLECLTGEPAFRGSRDAIAAAQLSTKPVAIPERVRKNPLGDIIAKAVSKDPAERYSDAANAYTALESLLFRRSRKPVPPPRKSQPRLAPVTPEEPPKEEEEVIEDEPVTAYPNDAMLDALADLDDDLEPRVPRNWAPWAVMALIVFAIVGYVIFGTGDDESAAASKPPVACKDGQTRMDEVCCWPGQSVEGGECRGEPTECPPNHWAVGNDCQPIR